MVFEAAPTLEQKWHRCVVHVLVLVVGDDEGDAPILVADTADDRRKHVGELGRDDEKAFGVGLGGRDLQQRDELSARRQPILDETVVGELGELFDADAGVAQHLDRRPGPKGPVLFEGQVAPESACRIFAPDAASRLRLRLQHRATERLARRAEQLAWCGRLGRREQLRSPVSFARDEADESGQHREAFPRALVHPGLASQAVLFVRDVVRG